LDLFALPAPAPVKRVAVKGSRPHTRSLPSLVVPRARKPKREVAETSRDAFESVRESSDTLRERVYQALLERGAFGATDQELQRLLGMHEQTQGPRRNELVRQGKVRDSGERRPTVSGRSAKVWIAVKEA
jgi:hypothetical protein